jgi:chromosome segregation ATPase
MALRTLSFLSALVMAMFQIGCTSSPGERIETTTSSMAELDALLDETDNQLDQLAVSMQNLAQAENLDEAYAGFRSQITALRDLREDIQEERSDLQLNAAAHLDEWRNESVRLSGDQAREISEERRRVFARRVQTVTDELDNLKDSFQPLNDRLTDLRVVLRNDLTRRGVELSQPLREEVFEAMREVSEQVEQTRSSIQEARDAFVR